MRRSDNLLSQEVEFDWVAAVQGVNIIAWLFVAVIVLGNIAWVTEKMSRNHALRRGYLNGSFDAIFFLSTQNFDSFVSTWARVLAMVYMFIALAVFAILTGVMVSLFSTAAPNEVYVWNSVDDLPRTAVACCPAPAYLDAYATLEKTDAYFPPHHSTEECLRDLETGVADVMLYDDVIFRIAFKNNATRAEVFQIIPGSEQIVWASAFPADALYESKNLFEQALIETYGAGEGQENADLFFPSADSLDDVELSTQSTLLSRVQWAPIGLVLVYIGVCWLFRAVHDCRVGKKCLFVRLAIVCKNQWSAAKLEREVPTEKARPSTLHRMEESIFQAFDADGQGSWGADDIDQICELLAQCTADEGVRPADVHQLKSMVLHLLDTDSEGVISAWDFQNAYELCVVTESAQQLLRSLARQVGDVAPTPRRRRGNTGRSPTWEWTLELEPAPSAAKRASPVPAEQHLEKIFAQLRQMVSQPPRDRLPSHTQDALDSPKITPRWERWLRQGVEPQAAGSSGHDDEGATASHSATDAGESAHPSGDVECDEEAKAVN